MKTCRDKDHKGDRLLPHSAFYETNPVYCKECVVRRVRETRKRQENQEVLINGYLKRHLQRREKEAQLAADYLPDQSEPENLNDPPPVWRDLTNCFLRPQTKVSSWKTA